MVIISLHKFKVFHNDREDRPDMPHFVLKSRTTVLARIFSSNTSSPETRALDRHDISQRIAQTKHLGKTIDDIPNLR